MITFSDLTKRLQRINNFSDFSDLKVGNTYLILQKPIQKSQFEAYIVYNIDNPIKTKEDTIQLLRNGKYKNLLTSNTRKGNFTLCLQREIVIIDITDDIYKYDYLDYNQLIEIFNSTRNCS